MGAAGNKKPKMKASKHGGKHTPAYATEEASQSSANGDFKKKK